MIYCSNCLFVCFRAMRGMKVAVASVFLVGMISLNVLALPLQHTHGKTARDKIYLLAKLLEPFQRLSHPSSHQTGLTSAAATGAGAAGFRNSDEEEDEENNDGNRFKPETGRGDQNEAEQRENGGVNQRTENTFKSIVENVKKHTLQELAKRQGSAYAMDYGLGGGRWGKRSDSAHKRFDLYGLPGGRFGRDVDHVDPENDEE